MKEHGYLYIHVPASPEIWEPTTSEDAIRQYYRWWTFGISRDYAKLGPVSLTWFRWNKRWTLGVTWLCRYVWHLPRLT